ncbi:hypothetical protein H4R99_000017 [Coemansia sp. RSA 1722]|nr:hypothetical protein IWW45_000101 [Coemansia sp. RSA 485]KAJ2606844.1 hypothetical protein H4R99_000017 [Coemansia sp. RSA 1722]
MNASGYLISQGVIMDTAITIFSLIGLSLTTFTRKKATLSASFIFLTLSNTIFFVTSRQDGSITNTANISAVLLLAVYSTAHRYLDVSNSFISGLHLLRAYRLFTPPMVTTLSVAAASSAVHFYLAWEFVDAQLKRSIVDHLMGALAFGGFKMALNTRNRDLVAEDIRNEKSEKEFVEYSKKAKIDPKQR